MTNSNLIKIIRNWRNWDKVLTGNQYEIKEFIKQKFGYLSYQNNSFGWSINLICPSFPIVWNPLIQRSINFILAFSHKSRLISGPISCTFFVFKATNDTICKYIRVVYLSDSCWSMEQNYISFPYVSQIAKKWSIPHRIENNFCK